MFFDLGIGYSFSQENAQCFLISELTILSRIFTFHKLVLLIFSNGISSSLFLILETSQQGLVSSSGQIQETFDSVQIQESFSSGQIQETFTSGQIQETFHSAQIQESFSSGQIQETFTSGQIQETFSFGQIKESFSSGHVILDGDNVPPLVEMGLTDLPKGGEKWDGSILGKYDLFIFQVIF